MRNNLIKFRGSRSQEEMAQIYGVSQQAWSNWEIGRDTPRPDKMLQIARDASSTIEAIFFDINNNKNLLDTHQTPTGGGAA